MKEIRPWAVVGGLEVCGFRTEGFPAMSEGVAATRFE
jgi:hypothetical protein